MRDLWRIAVTTHTEQETLQRMSDELDEVIAVFAETYAQMVELQRVLQRTCGRSEEAIALARAIRILRL